MAILRVGQPGLPGIAWPLAQAPICLFPGKVGGHAGHEVLAEVENDSEVIVGYLLGIFDL